VRILKKVLINTHSAMNYAPDGPRERALVEATGGARESQNYKFLMVTEGESASTSKTLCPLSSAITVVSTTNDAYVDCCWEETWARTQIQRFRRDLWRQAFLLGRTKWNVGWSEFNLTAKIIVRQKPAGPKSVRAKL
jgi:hypothetical protein